MPPSFQCSVWRSAGEIGDQLVPDRGSRLHATAADGRDWIQLIEWRDPIAVEQGSSGSALDRWAAGGSSSRWRESRSSSSTGCSCSVPGTGRGSMRPCSACESSLGLGPRDGGSAGEGSASPAACEAGRRDHGDRRASEGTSGGRDPAVRSLPHESVAHSAGVIDRTQASRSARRSVSRRWSSRAWGCSIRGSSARPSRCPRSCLRRRSGDAS